MIALATGASCVVGGRLHLRAPLVFRFHGKAFASVRVADWAEAHLGPSGHSVAARTASFDLVGEARPGELEVVPTARTVIDGHAVVHAGRVADIAPTGDLHVASALPDHVEGRTTVAATFPCGAVTLDAGAPPSSTSIRALRPGVTALVRSAPNGPVVARVAAPPAAKPGPNPSAALPDLVWGDVLELRAGAARVAIRGPEANVEGWVDANVLTPATSAETARAAEIARYGEVAQRMALALLEVHPEAPLSCRRPVPIHVRDGGATAVVGVYRAGAWIEAKGAPSGDEVPVRLGASELTPFVLWRDLARCDEASTEAAVALVRGRGLVPGAPLPVLGAAEPSAGSPGVASAKATTATGLSDDRSGKVGGPASDVAVGGHTESAPVVDAARVLAGLRARFRRCYAQGLASDPTMKGNVVLTIRVAPNGDVAGADVAKNAGVSTAVASCLAEVAKRAVFAAPGGTGSTLTVPFTFSSAP